MELPIDMDPLHLFSVRRVFNDVMNCLSYKFKYESLDVATGTSVDWVFNELDKKIGFTIEYRDTGRYGFILPPVQIIPNCEELLVGMLALIEKSKELGYF